jgi:Polysaccharide pyruvyl transferase
LNLLYSTTRQWNVGDEFICAGVKNLIKLVRAKSNFVIYNRNPLITPRRWTDFLPWIRKNRPHDNSWHFQHKGIIDAVIFAGSPEWRGGRRVGPLLSWIIKNNLPALFLGIGSHAPFKLHGPIRKIMTVQPRLVTCRDQMTHESIGRCTTSHLLPCPSIYALGLPMADPRPIKTVNKIAFLLQASNTRSQSVPIHVQAWMRTQYFELASRYDVQCIGHFIDDLALAKEWGVPVRYSGDSSDYPDFIKDCDLVISPRVHGCGLASALGIPSIAIQHDGRAETAERLGAVVVQPGTSLLECVQNTPWDSQARQLHRIKTEALPIYKKLLLEAFQAFSHAS